MTLVSCTILAITSILGLMVLLATTTAIPSAVEVIVLELTAEDVVAVV